MKLIAIHHITCNERSYEKTVIWAPDDMPLHEVQTRVNAAKNAYLEKMRSIKLDPPNSASPYSRPDYDKHPTKTVNAVKAIWTKEREVYDAWEKDNAGKYYGLTWYLKEQGLTPFWDEDMVEVNCDWGHNHGIRKDTTPTNVDQWPTIREMHEAIDRVRDDY
jgi:hypothetical protein